MKREIVVLHGRVQGVGFRERVVELARNHAVAGTVRNLTAGRVVEIDVEGDEGAVDAFVAEVLERKPFFAHVAAVERRPAATLGARGFERAATR
jgi:acylphosphatase